jgi:hypothetical protein
MAQFRISPTGGNINAPATFIEASIPGVSDHIVGLTSSGPLVVNVATTVQRLDFSQYGGLVTLNNNLTLGLAAGSTTFSASMSMTASSDTTQIVCTVNHSFGHLGTTPNLTNIRFSGGTTKTLTTDMYVRKMFYSSSSNLTNGGSIYIYSDLTDANSTTTETTSFYGSSTHFLQGEGIVNMGIGLVSSASAVTASLVINGTYSTFGNFLRMFQGASVLTISTSSNCTDLNVWLDDNATVSENYVINSYSKFEGLYIESISNNSSFPNRTITLGNTLLVDRIATQNLARLFTTDATVTRIRFVGAGISASEFYSNPTLRLPSSGSSPYPITYKTNDIELDPGYTHSIGNLFLQGVSTDKSYFSASSVGTVNLKVQNGSDSAIGNYNFTNINASTGDTLYALNGTLINTTNIQNTIPTGGGGQFAFAFIN